jgi:hypothetical protein
MEAHLLIGVSKKRCFPFLAKRGSQAQEVHGLDEVRFSLAVAPDKMDLRGAQLDLCVSQVPEVEEP